MIAVILDESVKMDWDAADNSDSNSDINFTPFNVGKRKHVQSQGRGRGRPPRP